MDEMTGREREKKMLTHCENNFDVKENQKLDKNQGIL